MDFQMKRVVPVALDQKSATLGRGGAGVGTKKDLSPDDDSYWHRPADLPNLRLPKAIHTLPRNHQHSLNGLRHKDILSESCHLPESSL